MARTGTAKPDRRGTTAQRRGRSAWPAQESVASAQSKEAGRAKLFMHGRSQAVRLPKEFRFPGKEVRVRRMGSGVLLEPMEFDIDAWFARLDALREETGPFMPEGREQPEMPPDEPGDSFDE